METNDSSKLSQEYAERFSKMTDEELIADFKRLFKIDLSESRNE